jgi:hypothetical protein
MRRLEIVHLRLSGPQPETLVRDIQESVAEQSGLIELRIYRSLGVGTDLSIHLHIDARSDDARVTELGLRLTDALKAYGMVERTLWSEVKPGR